MLGYNKQERVEGVASRHLEGGSSDHLLRCPEDLRKDSGEDAGGLDVAAPTIETKLELFNCRVGEGWSFFGHIL